MSEESQIIKVIGVDKNDIKASSESMDFWLVPFKLSQQPDQSWERKFYEVQGRDKTEMKRKARILDDYLRVEVASTDDLQKVLDVIKAEVQETNNLFEEEYQKKLKVRQEFEERQQKQRDATIKLKDDADHLTF